eukprot:TRINITY_DN5887_c0_g1_i1.p1 TRINITY_DN5887_c0_g1~~TRINITY_DN5887_c0_g1_i1.p1  ORF type:complete len:359 (+),score=138.65 TRINITY_DN5887_c0_g1_i1:71-1147(+)
MGQASCSELLKADDKVAAPVSSASKSQKRKEETKDLKADIKLPSVVTSTAKIGVSAPSLQPAPPEPAEIQRLRMDLEAKEQALQALRQEAVDHMTLIEVLERETFMKDETLKKLQAEEASQKEVAALVAELRQKDDGIDNLRKNAEGQEESLRSLSEQAQVKGDMVQELMRALDDKECTGDSSSSSAAAAPAKTATAAPAETAAAAPAETATAVPAETAIAAPAEPATAAPAETAAAAPVETATASPAEKAIAAPAEMAAAAPAETVEASGSCGQERNGATETREVAMQAASQAVSLVTCAVLENIANGKPSVPGDARAGAGSGNTTEAYKIAAQEAQAEIAAAKKELSRATPGVVDG